MAYEKWGQLNDLSIAVDQQVLNKALEASWAYVFDSTNWDIQLSSSTSGMYGSWSVAISPTTTVKDMRVTPPIGVGGSPELAFLDFIQKMENFNDTNGFTR